ncbi:MAG: hypothetical protein VB100_11135 [Angelakisella sp.]|nr:hypothetical protein [Angelakisella sp.]
MDANFDYLGLLQLLDQLYNTNVITEKERNKIADTLTIQCSADIIILP